MSLFAYLIGVPSVIAAGAWLRWSTRAVILAYEVGRAAERIIADPARFGKAFGLGYGIGARDRKRGQ